MSGRFYMIIFLNVCISLNAKNEIEPIWVSPIFAIFQALPCKVIRINMHKPNKDKPALNIDKDRPAKYTKINKVVPAEKEPHI